MWEEMTITQSLPICCALAAVGGLLEVAATAVSAIPMIRETQWGEPAGPCLVAWATMGNLCLQAIGSILSHLVATWFGPVSIVVPFFYSATLLSNILIFGVLLGSEFFSKTTRVGSYVIVVAVILLPVVGPEPQDDQNIIYLFHRWYAIAWLALLLCATAATAGILAYGIEKFATHHRFWVLLTARAASISINLTVSKSFVLSPSHLMLVCFIILKLSSGFVYTYAILVQAQAVDQARFVPLNTTTIIVVNALTGIFIWEDWRVIHSWYGYACVFCLLGLGCDLLLTTSMPLLNEDNPMFTAHRRASVMFSTAKSKYSPRQLFEGYRSIPDLHVETTLEEKEEDEEEEEDDELAGFSDHNYVPVQTPTTPDYRQLFPTHRQMSMSRRDAWRTVIMDTPRRVLHMMTPGRDDRDRTSTI